MILWHLGEVWCHFILNLLVKCFLTLLKKRQFCVHSKHFFSVFLKLVYLKRLFFIENFSIPQETTLILDLKQVIYCYIKKYLKFVNHEITSTLLWFSGKGHLYMVQLHPALDSHKAAVKVAAKSEISCEVLMWENLPPV